MKIIDLLNKIANGEEVPKKIEYEGHRCDYDEECFDYFSNNKFIFTDTYYLFKNCFIDGKKHLNDELEILDEEDEFEDIEEITSVENSSKELVRFADKINDLIKNQKKIIDKLNKQNI